MEPEITQKKKSKKWLFIVVIFIVIVAGFFAKNRFFSDRVYCTYSGKTYYFIKEKGPPQPDGGSTIYNEDGSVADSCGGIMGGCENGIGDKLKNCK